ncbi:MAG: hypothetical protein A2Y38_16585 [Spirochaetes bacterium GWB1_59_5]|nr:MAG: hypothetical protein A2Y38_16585 [Spirochaetes bacterium GWB1_59_5]
MNLSQYLTQYSPLPSGTIAAHLLAIANQVNGQTIFCSQINTVFEQDELIVTRKAKRTAPQPVQAKQVADQASPDKTNLFVRSPAPLQLIAIYEPDEITVLQRSRKH